VVLLATSTGVSSAHHDPLTERGTRSARDQNVSDPTASPTGRRSVNRNVSLLRQHASPNSTAAAGRHYSPRRASKLLRHSGAVGVSRVSSETTGE
jgi:hypothetical protein